MSVDKKETELKFQVPETDFDGITVEVGLLGVVEAMQATPMVERNYTPSTHSALSCAYRVLRTVHSRYLDTIKSDLPRYPEDPHAVELRSRS